MKKEEIKGKIIGLAREELGVELSDETPLKESGLDSLSLVTLITVIEEFFLFAFEDDDLQPDKLLTLDDLATLTGRYL